VYLPTFLAPENPQGRQSTRPMSASYYSIIRT